MNAPALLNSLSRRQWHRSEAEVSRPAYRQNHRKMPRLRAQMRLRAHTPLIRLNRRDQKALRLRAAWGMAHQTKPAYPQNHRKMLRLRTQMSLRAHALLIHLNRCQ